ncbi:blue copper protein [Carica papaya]|uniref:blue copper protein n=1 Tax=Carica papaya TaxID=3649 RepID=UPI000B8C7D1F|nr:blue copper protein [Carica papaya]
MEQKTYSSFSSFFFFFFFFFFSSLHRRRLHHRLILLIIVVCFCGSISPVKAYKNYTVGDSLGWFDSLEKPGVDYQEWADGKHFSLGDFLIFNTDNNHSVVQTYNFTTYKLCDDYDALGNDTIDWLAADPSAISPQPVTVAVPLVKEGMNYFFSGYYDGEQCEYGQRFKINVTHGQGLPQSLKSPAEESPAPYSPQAGDDDESAPDTIVPSNFDHPRDESDVVQDDSAASISLRVLDITRITVHCLLILVGLVWLF